jgi:hypothetical protein
MNAEKLEQLGKVHEEIGSTLWPHGAILKCVVCRHQERITAQQAAYERDREAGPPACVRCSPRRARRDDEAGRHRGPAERRRTTSVTYGVRVSHRRANARRGNS